MKFNIIALMLIATMSACAPSPEDTMEMEAENYPPKESLIIEDGMEEAENLPDNSDESTVTENSMNP